MNKIAILVLTDAETHGDLGRAVNALEVAKEFKDAGDQVTILFDGAGTRWIAEFSKPEHKRHALFESLRDVIHGACAFCSAAFGVKDAVTSAGVALLDAFEQHPSIRSLVNDGYQVITF
ncbi:MAG: sulfur reduction protein DsrE [Deinococcales bacterium]